MAQDKNPWGKPPSSGSNGSNRPDQPPELDELLKKAQENLRQVMPGNGGMGRMITIGIVIFTLVWLATGFYRILPEENGLVMRFGQWVKTQEQPGLGYHIPWPIESIEKVNVTFVRQIDIGRNADERLMLTGDANIVDIELVVQWNIADAKAYLFNIRDQENTIRKVSESAIREVIGQSNMQNAITEGRAEVAKRAEIIMQEMLDSYDAGVTINQVLIQDASVPPEVKAAFDDVVAAQQYAEKVKNNARAEESAILNQAEATAQSQILDAEGYMKTKIADARGDAQRFTDVYMAYKQSKDVTRKRLYLETIEDVLRNAETIVVDSNAGANDVLPILPLNRKN